MSVGTMRAYQDRGPFRRAVHVGTRHKPFEYWYSGSYLLFIPST